MPDLIVGVITGGLVGAVVLGSERRISARATERAVADAQAAAVDRARALLQHEIRFQVDRYKALHPDLSLLKPLSETVASVSSGKPAEHVPGYRWAHKAASAATDIEALAEALDGRVAEYDRRAGETAFLGNWVRSNIREFAELDRASREQWSWRWYEGVQTTYTRSVEADEGLRTLMEKYAHSRDLLDAYRKAFIYAMDYVREEESEALKERARVRGGRYRQWRARRNLQKRIKTASERADLQSVYIVSQVDPKAV